MFVAPAIRSARQLFSAANLTLRIRQFSTETAPRVAAAPTSSLCRVNDDERGVRRIELNNPRKRNVLSLELINELLLHLDDDIGSLRAIVISASGRVFSSGHDLKQLMPETAHQHGALFALCTKLMCRLQDVDVPVIASVGRDQLAAAAGLQLVASCDLVVAARSASFSTPGVNFGLFCSTPAIPLVRSVPAKVAADMLFTGEPISAERALTHGLITRLADSDGVDDEVDDLLRSLLQKSRAVLALGKRAFYAQANAGRDDAYRIGCSAMLDNLRLDDCDEGLRAFAEKRKPTWST